MHRKQRLDYQTVESVNVRALLLNVDVNLSEERSRVVQSQKGFEGPCYNNRSLGRSCSGQFLMKVFIFPSKILLKNLFCLPNQSWVCAYLMLL